MSSSTSAVRISAPFASMTSSIQFVQQPYGWPGGKVTTDMPTIVNIRQDPFERTPLVRGETLNNLGGGYMNDFYAARILALRQPCSRRSRRWLKRLSSSPRCKRRQPSTLMR